MCTNKVIFPGKAGGQNRSLMDSRDHSVWFLTGARPVYYYFLSLKKSTRHGSPCTLPPFRISFSLCSCPFRIMTVVSVIPFCCSSSSIVFLLRLSSFCPSLWLGVRSWDINTFLRVRSSSSLRCLAFLKMVFLLLRSVISTRMGLVSVSIFLPSHLVII